ncbi:MAG: autotransporter domain-containing protein [Planctomycetaceae bacterium]|nr:autotransporter domain-containing protein [Planctomycetaceae bacterium]
MGGGSNVIDVSAGSINSTGKINANGGNNKIDISGTGVLATGSEITATGGSNQVKLDGQSTGGTISLGKTGTLGNNTIEIASGTNDGTIIAEGDKNTVNIGGGTNTNDITLKNDEHTINITDGGSNNDNIVAEGSKNKINISGGTNNGGSIDAQGNENELTIIGGTTGTKIDLGSNASGEGKNKITIAGGTNSSDIDADGGLNIVAISNGTNSGIITAGLQNNGRGDNQVLISGGNTSTNITTAGSNNIYDQEDGTITSTSVVDMASGGGERDTHVKIHDDAQMDGTIHAHDGLIEVWTKTANITGDITASHAGADTEWRLSGGNFSSTSHLTSVADGNAKNIYTISRDANLNNTTDAIHTTGTGTTEMTIKEMYKSNTNAISGTIILATDHNVLNLLGGAHITSAGVLDIQGKKSNTITFDLNSTNGGVWTEANIGITEFANYTFSNLLDLTHPDTISATNTVNIKSGNLDRGAAGGESIRGAGVGGTTSYHITGGTTRYINTNSGTGHLYYSGGTINVTSPTSNSSQVFNVRDSNSANKEALGNSGTTVTYNTGDYLAYSILNVGETSGATPTGGLVTVKGGATVTLGVMDYNDNDMLNANRYEFAAHSVGTATGINGNYNYGNHAITSGGSQFEAQISASHVLVEGGGNLIIHENSNNWRSASTASDTRNIIDDLTIQGGGHVTLDRTTIYGSSGANTAVATVKSEGYLHGFGYYSSALDHTPMRANVDGKVILDAGAVDASTGWITQRGGTLQPYNASLFQFGPGEKSKDAVKKLMGVVFESSDSIEFRPTSFLSTRLFHDYDAIYDNDANKVDIDGARNKLYYSDSVKSNSFDFSTIWSAGSVDTPLSTTVASKYAQSMKAQYDPVFGFDYELKSKLDFELYQGLPNDITQTYYYRVATADNAIEALHIDGDSSKALMADANHLFNRNILKSDMLGEWTFLYTPDEKDIVLRFRLLADHPQNGGFVIDETERNNILPGKYLDEIRYPFLTNSDILNLPSDYAGDIAGLPEDPTMHIRGPDGLVHEDQLEYGGSGYSGNMVEWYRDPSTRPAAATNWSEGWMQDWEDLLRGVQLDIQSGADMRRGLRMMHAESYANVSSSNFNVMSQFIRNRERNAISALYQVEADLHKKAEDDGVIMKDGMEWHVPIIEQEELPFVENPIRFWASGFGQSGYVRNSGSEYGYDLESWGGALGVIKEFNNFYGGLTIGYADSKSTWDNLPSVGKTKSYMAEALVGMHFWDRYFVEGYFDYAYSEQTMNRTVSFGNGYYTGWAKGEFNDHTYAGGLRLGFQSVLLDHYVFVATAGAQIMHYTNDDFTEFGRESMAPLLKIHKGSMDRTIFKTPVTVRLSRPFALGGWVLTPEVRASFSPYFGDREGIAVAEWAGNPFPDRTFNSYGTKHGKYEAEIGGTIELSRRGRFYLAGNYDLTYTKGSILHNYSLQAGLNF